MIDLQTYYNHKISSYSIGGRRRAVMEKLITEFSKKRILDVGCAKGDWGQVLRRNGNFVSGWDISRAAVKISKNHLNDAFVVDLEKNTWPKTNKKYDLIIISEVIEHLFSPEIVLSRLSKSYLNKNGQILITTPNFLHFINRMKFLLGKFSYSNKGMFDESHIRFFTYGTLKHMVNNIDMEIVKENNVIVPPSMTILGKIFPSLFAYQFVVLVKNHE